MRRWRREIGLKIASWGISFLICVAISAVSYATPSTTFYTPCTTYIQPFKVLHLTYDSYFSDKSDFPTDVGLTIGILPWKKLQAELGFDLFLPGDYPLQFNARIGTPDDALFPHSPGINLGIWGVGTKDDVNNFNILEFNVGKTIPKLGIITVGVYKGMNPDLLEDEEGKDESFGWLVSYYRTLDPLTDRIAVSADYLSGENVFSGGGVGLYFWLTKSIDLIAGWVWFENHALNPKDGLFTLQLDVDLDFARFLEKEKATAGGIF